MAILEDALTERRPLTPLEILEKVRVLGLETPDEAVEMIRAERDSR